ncbi:hypothetical protein YB2330_006562 [Saitoella coloradoensis]
MTRLDLIMINDLRNAEVPFYMISNLMHEPDISKINWTLMHARRVQRESRRLAEKLRLEEEEERERSKAPPEIAVAEVRDEDQDEEGEAERRGRLLRAYEAHKMTLWGRVGEELGVGPSQAEVSVLDALRRREMVVA